MKIRHALCPVLLLLISACLLASPADDTCFVIDNSRPWIDIAFRRAGKRRPVSPGESDQGLWLALRNNCRYVIRVLEFSPPEENENAGTLLVHDVIPAAVISPIAPLPPGAPAAIILANAKLRKPPGYPFGDAGVSVAVQPGKELLFSVPLESVTLKWFIRIQVDLRIPGDRGVQPLVFVDFDFWQLPKDAQNLSDQMLDGALP